MRHAQASTTMNIDGNALMRSKRDANSKVVRMVLPSGERGNSADPEDLREEKGCQLAAL